MEFVVGIISLSCELYSLSWSCFRSRGSGTIVFGKWCFALHVECCGNCMVSTICVGQWFPKWAVPPPGGGEKLEGGGEAEMGGWGAIGDRVNNYISVVLLTLSD